MQTLEHIRARLPSYPVEVPFPDIEKWRHGNTGVDFVHQFDSGVNGPPAMVIALMHGNEVSGAIAVDRLLQAQLQPKRGRMTLGFANTQAYASLDPANLDAGRYIDEDMNRVWSADRLDSSADSLELRRARALRPIIDRVDFMLDLHSMHEEAPPLMLSGPLDKGIRFAAEIGVPEHVIVDAGHSNGRRMRDYGGFGDPASPKNALLIESGQHFSRRSKDVALDATGRFLMKTGVLGESDVREFLLVGVPPAQHFYRVTDAVVARTMDFAFTQDFRGMEVIARAHTVIAHDDGHAITTPYDSCVIVMPSLRHVGPGVTVMRLAQAFVPR